jgi:hypothetical protein
LILYYKNYTKKLFNLIYSLSKVAGYKINTQKAVALVEFGAHVCNSRCLEGRNWEVNCSRPAQAKGLQEHFSTNS